MIFIKFMKFKSRMYIFFKMLLFVLFVMSVLARKITDTYKEQEVV